MGRGVGREVGREMGREVGKGGRRRRMRKLGTQQLLVNGTTKTVGKSERRTKAAMRKGEEAANKWDRT